MWEADWIPRIITEMAWEASPGEKFIFPPTNPGDKMVQNNNKNHKLWK